MIVATDARRWDELLGDSALARLVRPHRWFISDEEPSALDETLLDGHLLPDGQIQLFNPGFDEHLIGVGMMRWFGYGHCALLAWHLHRLTGYPLTSLLDDAGIKVHTAVRTPDGQLLDWCGVRPATAVADDYTPIGPLHIPTMWHEETTESWVARWLPGGDPARIELGGHNRPGAIYDEFELALTDYLARELVTAR